MTAVKPGLKEPDFVQDEIFKTIIWRTISDGYNTTPQATPQAGDEIKEGIKRIVMVLVGEMKRQELQNKLGLRDRKNFSVNYLTPALEANCIEMTIPETPTHEDQRYRLTTRGIEVKSHLSSRKKKK